MPYYVFPQQEDNQCSIVSRISSLTEEAKARGIYLETLPTKPAVQPGCYLALLGDKDTNTAWYANIPYPVDTLAEEKEAGREEIRAISRGLINIDTLTDEQLTECISIYKSWVVNFAYSVGDICTYDNHLYQVVLAHTSQADWVPPLVPNLFTRKTPEGTIANWVQPQGAHDAYPLGAKVAHNDKIWESIVDANVWEPGVYGWTEVIA